MNNSAYYSSFIYFIDLERVESLGNCNTTGSGTWDIGLYLSRITVLDKLSDSSSLGYVIEVPSFIHVSRYFVYIFRYLILRAYSLAAFALIGIGRIAC